jgi:hypothetical protein
MFNYKQLKIMVIQNSSYRAKNVNRWINPYSVKSSQNWNFTGFVIRYGLIDYDGVGLKSQNRGHHWPIVHSLGECEWTAMVVMSAGDNS